jgi:hypothetical protein
LSGVDAAFSGAAGALTGTAAGFSAVAALPGTAGDLSTGFSGTAAGFSAPADFGAGDFKFSALGFGFSRRLK